jgi:hypothetical protein
MQLRGQARGGPDWPGVQSAGPAGAGAPGPELRVPARAGLPAPGSLPGGSDWARPACARISARRVRLGPACLRPDLCPATVPRCPTAASSNRKVGPAGRLWGDLERRPAAPWSRRLELVGGDQAHNDLAEVGGPHLSHLSESERRSIRWVMGVGASLPESSLRFLCFRSLSDVRWASHLGDWL